MPAERLVHLGPGRWFIPEDHHPLASQVEEGPSGDRTVFDQPELVSHRDDFGFDHDPRVALEEGADLPADVELQAVRPAFDEGPRLWASRFPGQSAHGVKPPRHEGLRPLGELRLSGRRKTGPPSTRSTTTMCERSSRSSK